MYICVCRAVTDKQIRQAVAEGASNLRALRAQLGVASQCGKCAQCAMGLVRTASASAPQPASG